MNRTFSHFVQVLLSVVVHRGCMVKKTPMVCDLGKTVLDCKRASVNGAESSFEYLLYDFARALLQSREMKIIEAIRVKDLSRYLTPVPLVS